MRTILILSTAIALGLSLVLTGCTKQQAERQRLQAELQEAKAALEKAKKEQGDLKTKLDAASQARDALAAQVNELTVARDRLEQQITAGETQAKDLQGQLGEMRVQRDAAQQQATKLTDSQSLLRQELDTMAKSRDAAAAEAQKAQQQVAELTTRLQAQSTKVRELQEQPAASTGAKAPTAEAIESPAIHSFATTHPRVSAGQSSTLSWRVSNADRIRIEPDIGTVGALGSRTVTPSKTTTYTLIATNQAGESRVTRRIEVF